MKFYRTMDLMKNGILISYLIFLVVSLFPSDPKFSGWWFGYHAQYYAVLCLLPFLAFCVLQFAAGQRLEKQGVEKAPLPKQQRWKLSAAVAVPAFLLLLVIAQLIPDQLEQMSYYVTVLFHSP